ncbi:tetratricopeptide repeat protein [Laspinema sp. D1]|uniref:Tetratricopeptide repeat protein n=1 Tax=Laspinema palackyanum D2a TaxID=2953684 RepID=A0ABT2MKR3_9CYAN|nr:tetratricopeptide repeat protein [Laspinema sp. D2a]
MPCTRDPDTMIVTDILPLTVLDVNRQTYKQLKLALSLNLRRQVFVAVCDDLPLRNRLAKGLAADLKADCESGEVPENGGGKTRQSEYPRLVSLELNLQDPNPVAQIEAWITRHPLPDPRSPLPVFQVLGLEKLTKATPTVQWSFLADLEASEARLSDPGDRLFSCSILLWVSRPWGRTIAQSAPQFWHCRTGLFEFEGEPTPVAQSPEYSQTTIEASPVIPRLPQENPPPRPLLPLEQSHRETEGDYRPLKTPTPLLTAPSPVSPSSPPSPLSPPSPPKPPAKLVELVWATVNARISADVKAEVVPSGSNALPLQLLEQVEHLHCSGTSRGELAHAYVKLGSFYRDGLSKGNGGSQNGATVAPELLPQYLTLAILAYEEAIALMEKDAPEWGDLANDLGNCHWMRSRYQSQPQEKLPDLFQAVELYHQGLQHLDVQAQPSVWARIQNNLGAVYSELARYQDRQENLQRSILAYQQALDYRKGEPGGDMRPYAATQNNLGTAYWNLAQHRDAVQNLKQAVSAYSEALRHHSRSEQPLEYGMIQNNLGTAYWNLAQYEQPKDYLMLAIAAYQIALMYRTKQTVPAAHAASQNNLGTAYWHLANHSQSEPELRAEFLQEAIAAYDAAITLGETLCHQAGSQSSPSKILAFDLIAAHTNLGLAHYQLVTQTNAIPDATCRAQHLHAALDHYIQGATATQDQPERHQNAWAYIVQIVRTIYGEFGIEGQTRALSRVPGSLLSELMRRL